jgi:hypothetical protein
MNFLTPLFLLGGLAIAAPVIFHLVRSSTRERTLFSSLMFLRPAPPQLTHRSKLEHWLLLVLRCLALGLLAFGFARPFLRTPILSDASSGQAKRIVVLLDTSASMRRSGLWAAAREKAESAVRKATPIDQVALFTFDRNTQALFSFEEWQATPVGDRIATAVARLAATNPGWGATLLDSALITAADALADNSALTSNGPRQIVLITDLQAGSHLAGLQSYEWPKGVELIVDPVKPARETNAGLQRVAESADTDRQSEAAVRVRVSNAPESAREQFQVGWAPAAGDGFLGAPLNVYVPPGQSRVVSIPVPREGRSERIVLKGDDEDFDNTVFVIPPEKQKMTALYLGGEMADDTKQPLFFLKRALPDTPRFTAELIARAPSATLNPAEIQEAKLFFVTDLLPRESAVALRDQAMAGKTVVFVPKNVSSAATLATLLGIDSVPMDETKPANYAMLADIDFKHPLFAPFADPRFSDFTKIHIWKYRRLNPDGIPGARVLAKFDNGDPALLEVPAGQGRILILTSGWQPDDSQLSISSKFVPLLYGILELSGGLTPTPDQYYVGDDLPLPGATAAGGVTVLNPDASSLTLPPDAKHFSRTLQPGIYQLTAGVQTQRIAVNVAAAESRTSPLPAEELERFGAPAPHPEVPPEQAARRGEQLQGVEMEGRQKLWRWFIVATLAILLVESALAGWTTRHPALSGGSSS